MNEAEYKQWRDDAKDALLKLYSEEQAGVVLEWFDRIKATAEYDLLGNCARYESMVSFINTGGEEGVWKLYNTMMARMFMYAPLILKEHDDAASATR